MSDIKVKTSSTNLIARVGQENAIKIIANSYGGGAYAADSLNSINVIGGIASVTQLYVSGISTLPQLKVSQLEVSGIASFTSSIYYNSANTYGISYFDDYNYITSTESSENPSLVETNLILTTNESGIPSWSNSIDGGTY